MKIFFLFAFLFLSCSSQPHKDKEEQQREISNDPLHIQADTFDRFVHGLMPPEELSLLQKNCRTQKENIFCESYLIEKKLRPRIIKKAKLYTPPTPKKIEPMPIEFERNKILNLNTLYKTDRGRLIKGLIGVPIEKQKLVAKQALNHSKCPNNLSIAVAASLEDFLPSLVPYDLIARLYVKAAPCATSKLDREHYFTRAGLFYFWNKDYKNAALTLKRSRSRDAFNGRALFWLARTHEHLKNKQEENFYWKELNRLYPLSFHNLIGLLLQKKDPLANYLDIPLKKVERSKRNLKANTFIEQMEILSKYRYYESLGFVAEYLLDNFRLETEVRSYVFDKAPAFVQVKYIPDFMIKNPHTKFVELLRLNYPRPFLDLIEKNRTQMDPYVMLSIARRESAFKTNAVSYANAQGLLQISQELSQRLMGGSSVDLLDPEWNIELSSRYLEELFRHYSGQLPMVFAAYNAGENAVDNWQRRYPYQDPVFFIDLIPYRETRDYVGYVMSNYFWYLRLYQKDRFDSFFSEVSRHDF